MTPAPQQLLVLEDSTLAAMANNDALVRTVPTLVVLRQAPAVRRGCRSCGGGVAARQRQNLYQQVKAQIASLPVEKKLELKRQLNARRLRVIFRSSNNHTTSLTF